MRKIYTHQNPALVANARALLEQAGIATVLRNEFAGGAVGELSFLDSWPEVWLLNDNDAAEAARILQQLQENNHTAADWHCPQCGENNAASFDFCWHCGADKL